MSKWLLCNKVLDKSVIPFSSLTLEIYEDIFSHTQLTLLRVIINWQLLPSSSICHHPAVVQEHECIRILNTMGWEISPNYICKVFLMLGGNLTRGT